MTEQPRGRAQRTSTAANIIDRVIEAPVVPSFTRLGSWARRRSDRWTDLDSYDMSGRNVLLTGATSGLGLAAATTLAHRGADLVLVGRDAARNQGVVDRLTESTGNESIRQIAADMGDLDQVRALAGEILADDRSLDVLIHNAGALTAERHDTPSGMESTVASQVVGPFLLTSLLLDRLAESAPSRVLTMSSGGMYTAKLMVAGLEMSAESYRGAEQYARAKRAQVVLNEEWAARFGDRGIHFHCLHPGWADTPGVDASLPMFSKVMGPLLRTPEDGADTLLWLAMDDAAVGSNGLFWHDRRPRSTHKLASTRRSDTPARRDRLWEWVTDAAGLTP